MNEILARSMLKDHRARMPPNMRTLQCPFRLQEHPYTHYHELCALLFPGWGRKHLTLKKAAINKGECPCLAMGHSYVKRRVQKFINRK